MTDYINKTFESTFKLEQIKYRKEILLEQYFGKPDEDALNFLEMAKKEVQEKGGYFAIQKNFNDELLHALYISEKMLKLSEKFLDIIIIDATYKKNRFNLPLVNIIGIDNYGHNILLAFGLLTNEKTESYSWLFQELKSAWKKNPLNVITDDSSEIQEGKN